MLQAKRLGGYVSYIPTREVYRIVESDTSTVYRTHSTQEEFISSAIKQMELIRKYGGFPLQMSVEDINSLLS